MKKFFMLPVLALAGFLAPGCSVEVDDDDDLGDEIEDIFD